MRAKHARLIRIGIMSKCYPYTTNKEPDPVFGGYFTLLDFATLREYQEEWINNSHIPLVREARERTDYWTKTRFA